MHIQCGKAGGGVAGLNQAGLEDRSTNFVAIHRRLRRDGDFTYNGFGENAAPGLISALLIIGS